MSDPLMQPRLDHLDALRERGIDPYPARVPQTERIGPILERHGVLEAEQSSDEQATVAGRITAMRKMGKASFLDLLDSSGRIQGHATVDRMGDEAYRELKRVDIGDFIAVTGDVFRTKRGELTVGIETFTFLSKAIRPLPEKWHGLKDVEQRHRHRSLDLISNDDVRNAFVARSRMISAMRRTLDDLGFLEVETPTLQPQAGGALARPFICHHNALDIDLYMRIALELYLKRVLIGGIDRVYEIGKCFRNEGVSTEHNPEFTMLEVYQAYADYETMMNLTERLIDQACDAIGLEDRVVTFRGHQINLSTPFQRLPMCDAIDEATGIDVSSMDPDVMDRVAQAQGIELPAGSAGKKVEALFERFVEPTLIHPTFITDYPIEISPLAKRRNEGDEWVERFELFVGGGLEMANAFSELNDPIDQRARFEAQERLRAAGDEEAHSIDEDFLFAMEHGMPPAGGLGIGIDRLVMLLTGRDSIREVILFPTLRERKSDPMRNGRES